MKRGGFELVSNGKSIFEVPTLPISPESIQPLIDSSQQCIRYLEQFCQVLKSDKDSHPETVLLDIFSKCYVTMSKLDELKNLFAQKTKEIVPFLGEITSKIPQFQTQPYTTPSGNQLFIQKRTVSRIKITDKVLDELKGLNDRDRNTLKEHKDRWKKKSDVTKTLLTSVLGKTKAREIWDSAELTPTKTFIVATTPAHSIPSISMRDHMKTESMADLPKLEFHPLDAIHRQEPPRVKSEKKDTVMTFIHSPEKKTEHSSTSSTSSTSSCSFLDLDLDLDVSSSRDPFAEIIRNTTTEPTRTEKKRSNQSFMNITSKEQSRSKDEKQQERTRDWSLDLFSNQEPENKNKQFLENPFHGAIPAIQTTSTGSGSMSKPPIRKTKRGADNSESELSDSEDEDEYYRRRKERKRAKRLAKSNPS